MEQQGVTAPPAVGKHVDDHVDKHGIGLGQAVDSRWKSGGESRDKPVDNLVKKAWKTGGKTVG